jgi:hypothetical protein
MTDNNLRERIYGMIRAGRSDKFILSRTDMSEESLRAYKAHVTREDEMGVRRNSKLDTEDIHNIVYEMMNRSIPRKSIYADPRLKGVGAQQIAGHIAAWTKEVESH